MNEADRKEVEELHELFPISAIDKVRKFMSTCSSSKLRESVLKRLRKERGK